MLMLVLNVRNKFLPVVSKMAPSNPRSAWNTAGFWIILVQKPRRVLISPD